MDKKVLLHFLLDKYHGNPINLVMVSGGGERPYLAGKSFHSLLFTFMGIMPTRCYLCGL